MKNDIESFIVRIWSEGSDNQNQITAWRGSIDHVGTSRRQYFHDLDSMLRFIEVESAIISRPSKSFWRIIWKLIKDFRHLIGIKNHAQDTN